jgi:adenylosuccinate lyase
VCARLGFDRTYAVTGQTYPRKVDALVLGALAGLGQSCARFAGDLRLLQGLHELEEPFGERQVGSSAMPYKRNPMRAERMSGLARFLMVTAANAEWTAASQWLERTLDDSANRRLAVPEAFLAADALLILYRDVVEGLEVREDVVARRLRDELPFLASEVLLAEGVKRGGSRQALHEALRRHAMDARRDGARFLEALAADEAVPFTAAELAALLAPETLAGLAARQTGRFLAEEVEPVLGARSELRAPREAVRV